MNLLDYDYVLANTPDYTLFFCLLVFVFYIISFLISFKIYNKLKGNFKLSDIWEVKENLIRLCVILVSFSVVHLLAVSTNVAVFYVLAQLLDIIALLFLGFAIHVLGFIQLEKIKAGNLRRKEEKESVTNVNDSESEE